VLAEVSGPTSSPLKLAVLGTLALLALAALLALGTWQVERRAWKLDLIARVDARIHAPATVAPGPAKWPGLTRAADEYRHVTAAGAFLPGQDTLVQATTLHGAGFWVLAPFRTEGGFTVLVNRGFVPADRRDPGSRDPGTAQHRVTGLLRMTEPGGGFLRSNDPAADRWHSRDVAAIAARRGMADAAPYFIDAEAVPGAAALPIGGLTVVSFPNSHLVYALTWYGLALMLAGAIFYVAREEWLARRRAALR
jgi:surfeit locus 1 family protein